MINNLFLKVWLNLEQKYYHSTMDREKIDLLKEELAFLDQSLVTLMKSVDKCTSLLNKEDYTFEEMESFDSLTSKFGRTSDLFTQKILRTIWILLHEPFVPFIDQANMAEKMYIIDSAEDLIEIRDLRNQITHEYLPEAIYDMMPDVIKMCHLLTSNIEKTKQFISNRNW